MLPPDQGTLTVGGHSLSRISSPAKARALGIAAVFQEVLVVDPQSVLDNVWLGADSVFSTRVPESVKRERATRALTALLGAPLPLDRPVEELELSERQVVVIARALVQEPKVLILDESTSALDVSTRDRLFAEVRRLCAAGTAVVFISHRMDELQEIADRSTVLRNGEVVGSLDRAEATPARLLQLMSAREEVEARERRARTATDRVVLRLDGVVLRGASDPISIDVHAGEIVGVAGLEGHGQERFVRTVGGLDQPDRGQVLRVDDGGTTSIGSQQDAARHGIAYVPRDRKTEGIFEPLSILDNFSLPTIGARRDGRRHLRAPPPRALPPVRRPAEDPLRLGWQPHHDALRRQPAEGRDRALARDGAGDRGAQRPDPRRRRGHQERHLRAARRPDDARRGRRDALDGGGGARDADGPRARLPRGRVFTELEGDRLTREALVAGFFGRHGDDGA